MCCVGKPDTFEFSRNGSRNVVFQSVVHFLVLQRLRLLRKNRTGFLNFLGCVHAKPLVALQQLLSKTNLKIHLEFSS